MKVCRVLIGFCDRQELCLTKQFADETYPLMVYLRELRELSYYAPSALSEQAKEYYARLKQLELSFFEEMLALVEQSPAASGAIAPALRRRAGHYATVNCCQLIKTRRSFHCWAPSMAVMAA
jgi:hypothetical protein